MPDPELSWQAFEPMSSVKPLLCPVCQPSLPLLLKGQSTHICKDCGYGYLSFNAADHYFGRTLIQRNIDLLEFKLHEPRIPCPSCKSPMFFTRPWAHYPKKEEFGALSPALAEWSAELRTCTLGYCLSCNHFGVEKKTLDAARTQTLTPFSDPGFDIEVRDPEFSHKRLFERVPSIVDIPEGTHPVRASQVLAGACILGTFLTDRLGASWSYDTIHPLRHGGLTLITSLFLHAGWEHLLVNLLFFFIFSSHLEPHLGSRRLTELFFMAGVAANLASTLFPSTAADFGESSFIVGASGAISGIMAYLVVAFPMARWQKTFVIPRYHPLDPIGIPFTVSMPILSVGLVWLMVQIAGHLLDHGSNIAYAAHIGGALGGLWFREIMKKPRP